GMEMMGYETSPDYFVTGGDLAWGFGQTKLGDAFVTPGERERFTTSAARPDLRFHYRFIAVDQAVRAADLLPQRSQAFAAVLCTATGWMLSTVGPLNNPVEGERSERNIAAERAQELYHRYVKEGPRVPWATHFGRNCPEPDFEGAARLKRTLMIR